MKPKWLTAIFVLFLFSSIFAGTTGKIVGLISDIRTGEPLPGVNVYIQGSAVGAATDADGFFTILNVLPGKYTINASYVGYATYILKNVEVRIDQTTRVQIKLKEAALQGEEVVVVGKRPVIVKDIANSQLNVSGKQVEIMPVSAVQDVVALQAGIEIGRDGLLIRGGSADQTVFMIDGFSTNDERSNLPTTTLSLNSIKEIQVQTGGFNAEYGQARSGIVNVILKEGQKEKYSGAITLKLHPATPKHFGVSLYDPYSFFNRPFCDPAVMWEGTDNGAWDAYMQKQYPYFEGWRSISDRTLRDGDPNNDLTPEGAYNLFSWYRRRQGDIKKADYFLDLGFGGPVPLISKKFGNLRFYFSYFQNRDMFVFPLSRDAYKENHSQLKITADASNKLKIIITSAYGVVYSVSPYNWTTTPTGHVLHDQEEIANLTGGSKSGMSILYMPGYFSPTTIYKGLAGIKAVYTLSPTTFIESKLEYKQSKYHTFQTEGRDTTRKYQPLPGYYVDEAPYGYWGYSATAIDGMPVGGWMNLGRDDSRNSTTVFSADMTSQLNRANQIKTGCEFVYNDYNIRSYTESPSMNTWRRRMEYHIFPYRMSAYFQDKLEFEGFIANAGLRMDYSNSNTERYLLSPYDELYGAGYGNNIEAEAQKAKAQSNLTFSPRLAISHPIGEHAKLYFNYGHFRSEPFSSYRFRIQRESNGQITYIGDPQLKQEKTVAYEVGYEHDLFGELLLKIAGYYKDVTLQPGWVLYQGMSDVSYYRAANNNYQDIRGAEFTAIKRLGRWFTGYANYTYEVKTYGYFGLLQYSEDANRQREYLRLNPKFDQKSAQPYARLNLDFHTPEDFGPQLGHIQPLAAWRLNVLASWKTGAYYTYNPHQRPGIANNTQWKDWYNVDLKIAKNLRWGRYLITAYMDIRNLLNFKYMSRAGFADQYDWNDYMESLHFSWEPGEEHGNDRIGDYRPSGVAYDPMEPNPNNDPQIRARNERRNNTKSYIDNPNITSLTFLNPRSIFFGITISF